MIKCIFTPESPQTSDPAVYRQIMTGIDWCTPEIIDQHLPLSGGQ